MDASAMQIGAWLVPAAAVMVMANQALKLTDRLKEKPIPADTYATKEACRQSHDAMSDRVKKLETESLALRAKLDEMDRQAELRSGKIHGRIDSMEKDIQQLPSTIIALLRNAKELS